jgi:DNA gyrase subunit B
VAMLYNNSFSENILSYVNNINTHEGGTHLSGFRRGLTRTLKNYAEKNGLLAKVKFEISGDDFREGLTAIISVKVQEPQFEGQTKTKLGNNEAIGAVDQAISEALQNYLEEHPKQARTIVDKVILAATARHAARKARGTAKQGRNREFQAILPLRGKILNVEKALEYKIYENQEIKNIFTALGVFRGTREDERALNLEKLRYHKIVIMCDADVDGSHITTLILTFFFRHMKELVEKGHVYIAAPPLYLVKKGKDQRYCWNEEQRQAAVKEMGGEKSDSVNVQRYKGLGEMNAEQLWETTLNPENRTLRQVSIDSAAEADRIFSMLMGDDVPPRRDFIEKNAKYAKVDA